VKQLAEAWFAMHSGTAVKVARRSSVKSALEAYLADLRRQGRHEAATDAFRRFRIAVYSDDLAGLELERLTRDDFLEWRERQVTDKRTARSVNRHARSVIAGLNRAVELGYVGNPAAWKIKHLVDEIEESGESAVFLTAAQRRTLIAAANPFAAAFLRGLELAGARPGELAGARVADFNGETLRLAHRKGRPPKLKPRHVVLSIDGVEFYERQAGNREPSRLLFTEDGEQAWRPHMWAKRIREAIAAHNKEAKPRERLPSEASAYSFRHARISELLQLHDVDQLTVAMQTGTSVAMIEKAYHKFIPSASQEKLASLRE
jgi:integrase